MKRIQPGSSPGGASRTAAASPRGASQQTVTLAQRFKSYRNHHKVVALESLQRLLATPIPTIMTVLVLAIAIALPAGLYVMLKNAQILSRDWDGSAQISLYLQQDFPMDKGRAFARKLEKRVDVARTQYISKAQALEEFQVLSGFGDLLSELDENPLPSVIVVYPSNRDVAQAEDLRQALDKFQQVDAAQLDAEWVQRLHAMLDLAERLVFALGVGLGLAVLLVVINTIRLAIEARRDEIVIVKMVGATDAFVRRPFLYCGLWYGFAGGLIALIIIESILFWVDSPVGQLANLYGSSFDLSGLGFVNTLMLFSASAFIGWLGAWLAVGQHLRAIEPR
ncbi:cell division protein [Gammaproteobacteria bacterium 45_16_T64]|nr:cell division protein [Gammaproteobacteria bacterium 45_16_T64]